MTRILVHEFLSGGGLAGAEPARQAAWLPQGRAMRDALLADLLAVPGLQVTATWCDAAPLPTPQPASLRGERANPGETPLNFLARLAPQHDLAWVVAPESDGLLLQCLRAVGHSRWLGCDTHSLRVASSKRATLAALAAAGCATPHSVAAPTQWVVKPDDGAGAVATVRLASLASAQALVRHRQGAGEAVTLEPWVPGEAMSLSLLCRAGKAELLSVNRQHIRVDDDGQVHADGVSPLPRAGLGARWPACDALGRRVARALPGLRGFVGVDLVWHPGQGPVAIEVNPRVTSAYVGLSAHLARNLAADVLAPQLEMGHVHA